MLPYILIQRFCCGAHCGLVSGLARVGLDDNLTRGQLKDLRVRTKHGLLHSASHLKYIVVVIEFGGKSLSRYAIMHVGYEQNRLESAAFLI